MTLLHQIHAILTGVPARYLIESDAELRKKLRKIIAKSGRIPTGLRKHYDLCQCVADYCPHCRGSGRERTRHGETICTNRATRTVAAWRYTHSTLRMCDECSDFYIARNWVDVTNESVAHQIQAILTGVPARDIVESYMDTRIQKLLTKVNDRNKGDGDDLEALLGLTKRAGKSLYYHHMKTHVILDVRYGKDLPTDTVWFDIEKLYTHIGGRPGAHEPLFILEWGIPGSSSSSSSDVLDDERNSDYHPSNWWTYHELVRNQHFKGFSLDEELED